MVSDADRLKRALVTLLLALAKTYRILLKVERNSPEDEVKKAVRKLSLKVHPDKGGNQEDQLWQVLETKRGRSKKKSAVWKGTRPQNSA